MPLSLNAIFGIPTRDEKLRKWEVGELENVNTRSQLRQNRFNEESDLRRLEAQKTILKEAEGLRANREDVDWDKAFKRTAQALVQGGLATPESANAMAAQALSAGPLGNIEAANRVMGGLPAARRVGESAAEATYAGNIAQAQEAQNRKLTAEVVNPRIPASINYDLTARDTSAQASAAEDTNRITRASTLAPGIARMATKEMEAKGARDVADYATAQNELAKQQAMARHVQALVDAGVDRDVAVAAATAGQARNESIRQSTLSGSIPMLTMGEIGLKDATQNEGIQRARTGRKRSLMDDDILDATRELQISNAIDTAQAQPQILQQTLESGRQGLDYGRTRNEMLGRENLQAKRLEGGLSTLYDSNPDMLTAPIRAQGEAAQAEILRSRIVQEAMKDPEFIKKFRDILAGGYRPGLYGADAGLDWRKNMPGGVNSMSPNAANDPMIQALGRFIQLPTQ